MLSMIDLFVLLLVFVMILPTTPAADEAGYVRLRMVEIPDEQGFGQPVVALGFLAPTDWRIEGGVRWSLPLQCQAELESAGLVELSPKGGPSAPVLAPALGRRLRPKDDPGPPGGRSEQAIDRPQGACLSDWRPVKPLAKILWLDDKCAKLASVQPGAMGRVT
jgi:hypothetical protein